jgi:hypothetical protein
MLGLRHGFSVAKLLMPTPAADEKARGWRSTEPTCSCRATANTR